MPFLRRPLFRTPLSPAPTHLPLKDTREIGAGPGPASGSRVGSIPPGMGSSAGRLSTPPSRRPECNRQHNDGAEGRARTENLKSRGPGAVRTLWAGSSLQVGRGRESPSSAPLRSRDTGWRLESLAVWSAGPCVHPPPRPALGFSWPLRLSPTGRGGCSSSQHGLPWPPERGL